MIQAEVSAHCAFLLQIQNTANGMLFFFFFFSVFWWM